MDVLTSCSALPLQKKKYKKKGKLTRRKGEKQRKKGKPGNHVSAVFNKVDNYGIQEQYDKEHVQIDLIIIICQTLTKKKLRSTTGDTVVPQHTSAPTYEFFEIRAGERVIFCFELRAKFEIRVRFSRLAVCSTVVPIIVSESVSSVLPL
ncbi:hypothetical protein NPIL_458971 [Nephila pilipes]|uniref:Uncharacterized protein n=1 Tax=Nephila pilipes TaxID=299642 RepID=A0A8X6UTD0_NEPPI|nr:hypothetical protein NPIL_458971 [Nephila pilipes]